MRKLLFALLLLALPTAGSRTTAAEPLTETQIAHLESLCRVWGTMKFFHPWIVAPPDGKPVDWDAALIETIPLVEKASTPEEFRAAIDHLLQALHDEPTRALLPNQAQAQTQAAQPQTAEPAPPESKVVEAGGKKILVVSATDWRRLAAYERKSPGELFKDALASAADKDAIVLDLRRVGGSQFDATVVVGALETAFATLIKSDLTLAARRSRFHSGYAPEQGGTSGGYNSGFNVSESSIMRAKPGPGAGKPFLILSNYGTGRATEFIAALQCSGQAVALHQGIQSIAPTGVTYGMTLADGVNARIRTSDTINADGSFGFTPDIATEEGPEDGGETLMKTALAIASGELTAPVRTAKKHPPVPLDITENMYPQMASPSREYRLLGLFRVWNVMHYFFPYKHLMDRSWDSVLTEFIPRFADAATPGDYGDAARELVANLRDSHVNAFGGPAQSRSGPASPFVLVRSVQNEVMISAIDDSLKDRLKLGDIVLEVDGEPIAARFEQLKKYYAASTPQARASRLAALILSGQPNTPAVVKLRDRSGAVREESLNRPPPARDRVTAQSNVSRWRSLSESTRRKTPVYSVLPEGYGYFDLVRLEIDDVNKAFDIVKETPALIMDMRGYPRGTAWPICARLTEKPMVMATFRRPYWTSPDSENKWIGFDQPIQPSPLWKYTRPIVVLINEDAISQSEHSCLGFEEAAKGRITFIGTPTTGANGDVTRTSMPGGISVTFSGHDVRHADGRQLQRVGIQPDIRVEPTIEGIVAGKDEVLEAAIKFLNEQKAKQLVEPVPAKQISIITARVGLIALAVIAICAQLPDETFARSTVEVSYSADVDEGPLTGRVIVIIAKDDKQEPRFNANEFSGSSPYFGTDVEGLKPSESAVIDSTTLGFPVASIDDLPAGDYFLQAVLNVYTQVQRKDGHEIWVHLDQWEGQQWNRSPGNLVSAVEKVHLDPAAGFEVKLTLNKKLPPVEVPPDSEWVKRIKIQSKRLSEFWGRPIYVGACVLLPRGYDEELERKYPVVYVQGHFSLRAPFGFTTQPAPAETEAQRQRRLALSPGGTAADFSAAWRSDDFPRMIAVTFQHPTPYYDDSYAVNSANNGPYGDALLNELIPHLEENFRIIAKPEARFLTGGSTGGWEALALQVFHPTFFNGTWVFFPDPVDFRRYQLVDIYRDENAFEVSVGEWTKAERPISRSFNDQVTQTNRSMSRGEAVLGSKVRSGGQIGAWDAAYGPVGADGYPKSVWDPLTGKIDKEVATYMRDHGFDLRHYMEQNWSTIGKDLTGKIYVSCGDLDTYYLNQATYLLEDFLKGTKEPAANAVFEYGRRKMHGWQPMSNADLVRRMAARAKQASDEITDENLARSP